MVSLYFFENQNTHGPILFAHFYVIVYVCNEESRSMKSVPYY